MISKSTKNSQSMQGKPLMLIGTPAKEIEVIEAGPPEDLPEVINDLGKGGSLWCLSPSIRSPKVSIVVRWFRVYP